MNVNWRRRRTLLDDKDYKGANRGEGGARNRSPEGGVWAFETYLDLLADSLWLS